LLTAALDGSLRNVEFRTDKYFGFAVPTALPGVPSEILNPVNTWKDRRSSTRPPARWSACSRRTLPVRSAGRCRCPRRRA
jgi:ATP-dependent phosphoenolpyruvate carboxykinase